MRLLTTLKDAVAWTLVGGRARRAFDAATADLAAMPLPDAVRKRTTAPSARARPTRALGMFRRALGRIAEREAPGHVCLPRSLALYGEARRVGLEAKLVVGVRANGRDLVSHAWLTLDGRPLFEPDETPSRFRPIAELP